MASILFEGRVLLAVKVPVLPGPILVARPLGRRLYQVYAPDGLWCTEVKLGCKTIGQLVDFLEGVGGCDHQRRVALALAYVCEAMWRKRGAVFGLAVLVAGFFYLINLE